MPVLVVFLSWWVQGIPRAAAPADQSPRKQRARAALSARTTSFPHQYKNPCSTREAWCSVQTIRFSQELLRCLLCLASSAAL